MFFTLHKTIQFGLSIAAVLSVVGVGVEKRYVDILDYARNPVATLDIIECKVQITDGYLERIKRPHLTGTWFTTSDILFLVDDIETLDDRELNSFWRHTTKLYLKDLFRQCK